LSGAGDAWMMIDDNSTDDRWPYRKNLFSPRLLQNPFCCRRLGVLLLWAEEVEPWLTPSEATSTFGRERAFFLWPKFGNMGLKWVHVVGYGIIWGPKKPNRSESMLQPKTIYKKNINTPNASQSICIRQATMYVIVFFAILRLQHECLANLVPHVVILNHTDA
jgi:hypothetical protein